VNYDIAFRFNQALDTSALTTIEGALHGVTAAIDDCRRAGKRADKDPAVLLLLRHLGSIATATGTDDNALRAACFENVRELRRHPVLTTLALRGVAYDTEGKKLFHSEGRRAMKALADALGYDRSDFDLRCNQGGIAVSGEITIHSDEVYIQLSCNGRGGEVLYRRCDGRRDYTGGRNHHAAMREVTLLSTLAARICHDLQLQTPTIEHRLVA
jgi:hypothetical protein